MIKCSEFFPWNILEYFFLCRSVTRISNYYKDSKISGYYFSGDWGSFERRGSFKQRDHLSGGTGTNGLVIQNDDKWNTIKSSELHSQFSNETSG